MIHPSYTELIDKINAGVEPGEEPVVQSRYSIVIAAAKRARQIIAGEEAMNLYSDTVTKPLSQAVEELNEGIIHIMTDEEFAEAQAKLDEQREELEAQRAQLAQENQDLLDISEEDEASEEDADEGESESSEEE